MARRRNYFSWRESKAIVLAMNRQDQFSLAEVPTRRIALKCRVVCRRAIVKNSSVFGYQLIKSAAELLIDRSRFPAVNRPLVDAIDEPDTAIRSHQQNLVGIPHPLN